MKLILLVVGMVLLCGNVYADIGYTEINLVDYKTNNFIHVNSTIPLSDYTFELKTGRNWIGIPFNTTITRAADLMNDIPNMTVGSNIKYYNKSHGTYDVWTRNPWGDFGDNFLVKPNRGYEISILMNATWTIKCLQPVNPILQYQCFDLNKYIGTNIVRVRNI